VVTADLTAASPELGNDPLLTAAGRGHLIAGHDNKAMPAQTAAANSPVFCEGAQIADSALAPVRPPGADLCAT
jgi:hypothetical protein